MRVFLGEPMKVYLLIWNYCYVRRSRACLGKPCIAMESKLCKEQLQFYDVKYDQNGKVIPTVARIDFLWTKQSRLIMIRILQACLSLLTNVARGAQKSLPVAQTIVIPHGAPRLTLRTRLKEIQKWPFRACLHGGGGP